MRLEDLEDLPDLQPARQPEASWARRRAPWSARWASLLVDHLEAPLEAPRADLPWDCWASPPDRPGLACRTASAAAARPGLTASHRAAPTAPILT